MNATRENDFLERIRYCLQRLETIFFTMKVKPELNLEDRIVDGETWLARTLCKAIEM